MGKNTNSKDSRHFLQRNCKLGFKLRDTFMLKFFFCRCLGNVSKTFYFWSVVAHSPGRWVFFFLKSSLFRGYILPILDKISPPKCRIISFFMLYISLFWISNLPTKMSEFLFLFNHFLYMYLKKKICLSTHSEISLICFLVDIKEMARDMLTCLAWWQSMLLYSFMVLRVSLFCLLVYFLNLMKVKVDRSRFTRAEVFTY